MSVVERVVIDTSTLVSAALRVASAPHQAMSIVLSSYELCASVATLSELELVLGRKKFDSYLDLQTRRSFSTLIRQKSRIFQVTEMDEKDLPSSCRDPKDNKFLALTAVCKASVLVTSDSDLLVLHPWFDVPVLSPTTFLDRHFKVAK